ncbi:MAG: hypothetical protein KDA69_11510 [Planctomycetaceae bacterium]|nr:hypothetical protein [Planctomycetaceae bacterium]
MLWGLLFSRDARHLRIVVFLILLGGAGAFWVRQQLIPPTFGKDGPYRKAALEENESRPMRITTDATCLKCHESVHEERMESPHQAVACMHCHGMGHDHMAQALLAQDDPNHEIPEAAEWDGNFMTKLDLFVTQDRAICLSCHQRVVGMPASFRSIVVAEHLDEQGASEPNDKNVCFECHEGHSPGL